VATSGTEKTVRIFDTVPGAPVYVQVYDRTRMEGVRAVAGGAGGAVGGASSTIDGSATPDKRTIARAGAAGAIVGAAAGAQAGFRGDGIYPVAALDGEVDGRLAHHPDAWVALFPVKRQANRHFGAIVESRLPAIRPNVDRINLPPIAAFKLFCGLMPRTPEEFRRAMSKVRRHFDTAIPAVGAYCDDIERDARSSVPIPKSVSSNFG
jgi:hypothetical protein